MKIHVKIQGKTFSVRLGDIQARPIRAEVNGEVFEVWPEETLVPTQSDGSVPSTPRIAHPVAPVDAGSAVEKSAQKSAAVIAPIPGVIVEITVQEGDAVVYGQELCVLEAMKMKNSIRANRDGTIKEITAVVGEHVQQSQVLMVCEPGED